MTERVPENGLLGVAAAARRLGVSPATLRRASDAGLVPCRRSPGGHRRYAPRDLADLTRRQLLGSGRHASAVDRKARQALFDLSEAAALWQRPEDFMRDIAERLLATTGAVDCDVFRLEEGDVFRCLVSRDVEGFHDELIGTTLRTDDFEAVREAIDTGTTVYIADRGDPRMNELDLAAYERWGFESELCVPLIVRGRVVGLVELYADRPGAFDGALPYVRGAAHIVAGALEKALIVGELEDRERVLRELLDLAGLLARTYDVDELMHIVAARLVKAVGAAHCDIYNRERTGYRCVASVGADGPLTSYEGSLLDLERNPMSARSIERRETLVVADVEGSALSDRERDALLAQGLASELCIPVLAKSVLVGLIDLFDTRPRDWQECIAFAGGVGQLVAGALANAGLLAKLEAGNRDLRVLIDGGLEFGATLDAQRVLLSIGRKMRASAGATSCDIYAAEGDELHVLVAVEADDSVDAGFAGRSFPIADYPLTRLALRSRAPVSVYDILDDPRASLVERRQWQTYDVRSALILPLVTRAELVGVVAVYDSEPRSFEKVDLLRGLSQVAGQAIANARLHERLDASEKRASLLNEISAELATSLDTDCLLDVVVRRLREVVGVPRCTAHLLEDGDQLVCVAHDGEPASGSEKGSRAGLDDRPISRLVVKSRKGAAIAGLDDPRIGPEAKARLAVGGTRSCLVAPLLANGEVIGTVQLTETRRERGFTIDEITLVEAVCRVAGIAIEKSLLFGDLEQRNREAELLNDIARRTSSSLDLGEIADAAVQGLSRLAQIDEYRLLEFRDGRPKVVHAWPQETKVRADSDARIALELGPRLAERRVLIGVVGAKSRGSLPRLPSWVAAGAAVGLFDGDALAGALLLGSRRADGLASLDRGMLERVGVHLSLAANNASLYQEIKTLHLSNLKGLSTALNAKDYYTLGHAARVAAYMVLLGEELGWEPEYVEQVREAAYLHDIGKIGVSDRVLLKQGPLNAEEWELMRQHPVVSAEIIKPLFPEALVAAVRHHHERFDGAGYPDGIGGDDIPELARAMCVADSYDAMSLQRPYRAALTSEECLAELERCSGAQFDPAMVAAFRRVLDRLAGLRETAERAAAEAAARIDVSRHATLREPGDEAKPAYAEIRAALCETLVANPSVRFLTTEVRHGTRHVIVVDAEDESSPDFSPLGEEVMADDTVGRLLSGKPTDSNVLFVDNFGVWVNGLVALYDERGEPALAVVADVPALSTAGSQGFARMTTETPVSTLEEAAVRLSRAEIDAITDGLTGLYNHRYLHERLAEELGHAQREGRQVSLLFADLDHFKEYNDRLGHAAGDLALRSTARLIEGCVRRADLVARYGGEEFVVVLPDAPERVAVEIAATVRAAVAEKNAAEGLTISVGVATAPADGQTKEDLLEAADRAMYQAKDRGRDRVVPAGGGKVRDWCA